MTAVRLIISVDGTSNTEFGSLDLMGGTVNGVQTSVKRIHDLVKQETVTDPNGKTFKQEAQYFQGVGTQDVTDDIVRNDLNIFLRPRAVFKAGTAAGYLEILRAAYKVCCERVSEGNDEIWMFGFSRGAFIVRALASLLQHVGMIKRDEMLSETAFRRRFSDQLQRYMLRTSVNTISSLNRQTLLPFATKSPRIRFMGVFDTVKSTVTLASLPGNTIKHQMPFIELEQDAPRLVQHLRHVVAMNEGRPHFAPTLWTSNADSTNMDATFLEAWFFGFHTDVGGGSPRRGVALWPLQWMMDSAREKGLILDTTKEKYTTLFQGAQHSISMPHDPKIQMYDMMDYHAAAGRYRLLLHEARPCLQLEPRDYSRSLTKPAYPTVPQSRVFIHPSAYLQFNIDSSFRIQLCEWKWFHSFVGNRNRLSAIPDTTPWWEEETKKNILREVLPLRRMRLLIFGEAGSGKLALINRVFGDANTTPALPADITQYVQIPGNDRMFVHYSDGFPPSGKDSFGNVQQFITDRINNPNIEDQLHAIWYCVDLVKGRAQTTGKKFSELKFGKVPVTIVFTKEDEKRLEIRQALISQGTAPTDENVEIAFGKEVKRQRKEIRDLAEQSFVSVGSSLESGRNLLSVTFQSLEDKRIQITEIIAQRVSARMKLAIATDQALRAYSVWKAFALNGTQVVFRREPPGQMKLSAVLMQPVLDIFNMRVTGGADSIRQRAGLRWQKDLDRFPTTLHDAKIPAHLILCCMADTMIIMARTMRSVNLLVTTVPLQSSGIEAAWNWYSPRQGAVHKQIADLLAKDSPTTETSMAILQLGLIDAIETGFATGSTILGDTKDALVGAGVGLFRGVTSAAVGTAKVTTGLGFGLLHEGRRNLFG